MLLLPRRQLIVVPIAVVFGFFTAYIGFRNGLPHTVFGSRYDVGGGYNALGRLRPLNTTAQPESESGEAGKDQEIVPDGLKIKDLAVAVENGTLGFGRIFVLDPSRRSEQKDAMVLASVFSKLQLEWVGDLSDREDESTIPPSNEEPESRKSARGNSRANLNAIRATVEQDISSALILESDLDWDIQLKEQMHTFALSARTLTQPLAVKDRPEPIYADASFPDPSSHNEMIEIPYEDRPATILPSGSAYGDNWDILWLGHCNMKIPTPETSMHPKGRLVLTPDPSVALHDVISINGGADPQRENYTEHTRLYHHAYAPECSLAYAVSQRGARRILHEHSTRSPTSQFDIVLRELCDGIQEEEPKLTCLTTQPSLFSRWRMKGDLEKGGAKKWGSEHIRLSVRMNMGKFFKGGNNEWNDQYPD
ncbi:hypothetical protein N0V90_007313 [Kalmusia sp. IMI 367209]|nr:hypothetical protein N0V90_007313 [Kalmusia sp. IMI 367209]